MDAYVVRVLTEITIGDERAAATWIVRAGTPKKAAEIVTAQIAKGCEIQATTKAPPGIAERLGLAPGQAHHL